MCFYIVVSFRYISTKALREKYPYSELFWSVFSHIWTEYLSVFRMRENTDQKNSEYGHFLRSEGLSDEETLLVLGNNKFMIQSLAFQDKLLSIAFFISDINLAWSKKHVNLNHNHVVWQLKFRIASTALGVF